MRRDEIPAKISPGEVAALAAADPDGVIRLPVYNCLEPTPPRTWGPVHLRYLERRGRATRLPRRADGLFDYLVIR